MNEALLARSLRCRDAVSLGYYWANCSVAEMWWDLIAVILVFAGVIMWRRGPVAGLGGATLAVLVFPCWLMQDFFGTPIDLRIATALILLLGNLAYPVGQISWRFRVGDWAVLGLYCVHVASDTWHDGLQLSHFVKAFGEWSIPYIAGRLSIQTVPDWRWLIHLAAVIVAVFGVWSATEAICKTNPGNVVFGVRPTDRTDPMQLRAGFKRAEGPCKHPIWFGMLQMLFLPWVITGAYRALRVDGPIWWFTLPAFCVVGILATGSRGPLLTCLLIPYFIALFMSSRWRKALIAGGLIVISVLLIGREHVINAFEKAEARYWNSKTKIESVELDGQQYEFTAMSARWLVLRAYRPAALQAGLLGYGTARTSKFPVNVPMGADAKQAVTKFWTIDCAYLLLILRFGWLGCFAFIALITVSVIHALKKAELVPAQERIFLYAVAATLLSTGLILMVEWMPHDFGFLFLWLCGAANGLRRNPNAIPRVPMIPSFRLQAG